jgi:type I restriction enzyme S subunit
MAATKNVKPFYNTEIPDDWEIKRIEDVCSIFVGRDLKEDNFSPTKTDEFNIPVYSNTVENEGLYGYYNIEEFTGASLTIVGRGAGLGRAFSRNLKFGAIGRLLVLFPKEDVHAQYVTEFINGILRIHPESGGIPQLTGEQISKYKISMPSYAEQKAIAQVLSTADAAIRTIEKLIVQKELRKKWLMQQFLTGKKRLKGFGGEWKEIKLGDIGEIKTSGVDKVLLEGEKIVNLVNYMDVYRNRFISPEFECKKTSANEREINTFNLRKGDILFTPSSETPDDIGHSAVVTADLENTVYSYHLVRFRLFQETALAYNFRAYVFNNQNILNEFSRRATGSTRFTISKSDFEEIKTEIPPSLEEQTAIAQVLQAADKEITLLKAKVDKLREQKKGLMQVLLTGKVRLNIKEKYGNEPI